MSSPYLTLSMTFSLSDFNGKACNWFWPFINENHSLTIPEDRTTCDGTDFCGYFGADCWGNPIILLFKKLINPFAVTGSSITRRFQDFSGGNIWCIFGILPNQTGTNSSCNSTRHWPPLLLCYLWILPKVHYLGFTEEMQLQINRYS